MKNNLKCNSCHFVRKTRVFEIIFDFLLLILKLSYSDFEGTL